MRNKKLLIPILFASLLIPFLNALALELKWPDSPGGTTIHEQTEIHELIKYIYEWGISLGVIASFIALVIAGVKYMSSTGNTTKIAEAKEDIKYSIGGVVLLLCTWLILNTINPDLTKLEPLQFTPTPGDLADIEIKIPTVIKGECALVVFYEEENFGGQKFTVDNISRKSVAFSRNFSPKSFIAYRQVLKKYKNLNIEDEDREQCNMLIKQNPLFCTKINGVEYIRDDSCVIKLYAPSSWITLPGSCGDTILSKPGFEENIPDQLNNPVDDISCYSISP